MQSSRTPASLLLARRLDPDYYGPQHLEDERRIRDLGAIELGTVGKTFVGPFGSLLPTSVFVAEGVPLFRVGNVGSMEVDEHDLARIPAALHRQLRASEVGPGDLLVVKASVGEKICVVPDSIPKANITQHIIGLRGNRSADLHYVAAALYGVYGRRQLQRRALGAIIQYLGLLEARTVLLPRLHPDAQAYIGSKVRQAEALRTRAREGWHALALFWLDLLGGARPNQYQRSYRSHSRTLSAERMDSWFYNPRFLDANRAANNLPWRLVPLADLAPAVVNGATPAGMALSSDTGVPWMRGRDLAAGDVEPLGLPRMDHTSEARIRRSRLGAGDVVLSIKGTVGDVCVVNRELAGANINQDLARIAIGNRDAAGFVAGFLETELGQALLEQQTYGSVNRFVSLGQLKAFRVIDPNSVDSALVLRAASLRRLAVGSRRAASRLTTAARLLVEALIERKVTEADLMAAHRDPARDRELLARLSAKGLDIGGEPPLFADLNALFDLVAATQEKETP